MSKTKLHFCRKTKTKLKYTVKLDTAMEVSDYCNSFICSFQHCLLVVSARFPLLDINPRDDQLGAQLGYVDGLAPTGLCGRSLVSATRRSVSSIAASEAGQTAIYYNIVIY